MKLQPDIQFFPIGEDVVLFSEEAQNLLILNASAAKLVARMMENSSASDTERDLVHQGISSEEAKQWLSSTIETLGSYGMLADVKPSIALSAAAEVNERRLALLVDKMPPYAASPSVTERRYRLLDTCTLIRFASLEQVPWVDSVIGHLAIDDSSPPTNFIDLHYSKPSPAVPSRSDVYCNQERAGYAEGLNRLGPIVKSALWHSTIDAQDYLFYFHAGVVGTGRSSILLPAEPGSGKSSLTAALRHSGFQYYSDEAALVEPVNFDVRALPLSICVKSTGWDVIARYFPSLLTRPIHYRGDGKIVHYLIPRLTPQMRKPCPPVSHIIFPRYAKDAPTELKPLACSEALRRLMKECLTVGRRLDRTNVADLVRWIAGIECYTLTFSSLDEATAQIIRLSGFTRAEISVS